MLEGEPRQHEFASAAPEGNEAAPMCSARFGYVPEAHLLSFFLALSLEQRIARFGIPCSDDAIRTWRSTIDRGYYLPIALERRRRLAALVELFGSSRDGWKRPELAITLDRASGTPAMRSRLVDIGLGTAHGLGAADVLMNLGGIGSIAMLLTERGGRFDQSSGISVVPTRSLFQESLA